MYNERKLKKQLVSLKEAIYDIQCEMFDKDVTIAFLQAYINKHNLEEDVKKDYNESRYRIKEILLDKKNPTIYEFVREQLKKEEYDERD